MGITAFAFCDAGRHEQSPGPPVARVPNKPPKGGGGLVPGARAGGAEKPVVAAVDGSVAGAGCCRNTEMKCSTYSETSLN